MNRIPCSKTSEKRFLFNFTAFFSLSGDTLKRVGSLNQWLHPVTKPCHRSVDSQCPHLHMWHSRVDMKSFGNFTLKPWSSQRTIVDNQSLVRQL